MVLRLQISTPFFSGETHMKRLYRVGFTLLKEENEMLSKLAMIEGGLSKAALIRRLIRQSALEKGAWNDLTRTSQEKTIANDSENS